MQFLPFDNHTESIFVDNSMPQILKIVHSYGQADWSLPAHSHPDQSELMYIAGGKATYTVENYPYHVRKGDVVIFNSGVIHSLESDPSDPVDIWSCAVTGFQLPGLPNNHVLPAGAPPIYASGERGEFFSALYQEILYQRQSRDYGYQTTCNALATTLILKCIQLTEQHKEEQVKNSQQIAQEVIAYLDSHYAEPITMQGLAEHFHISASRLSHIISENCHISPISYVIDRRIRQAQWELVSTHYSIKDIAEHVGYDNTHHFCKLFAERTGWSPSELREKYTQSNK